MPLLFPKPERQPKPKRVSSRRREKDRERRREKCIIGDVRSEVDGRDGYCRLYVLDAAWRAELFAMFGACRGASELAHFGRHRRARTRGQAPELRHTVAGSLKLCNGHHQSGTAAYDAGTLLIEAVSGNGTNGRLTFSTKDGLSAYTESI